MIYEADLWTGDPDDVPDAQRQGIFGSRPTDADFGAWVRGHLEAAPSSTVMVMVKRLDAAPPA